MKKATYVKELEFAIRTVRQAGTTASAWWQRRSTLKCWQKSDGSWCSEADEQVERQIRDSIIRDFPYDAVRGEELGQVFGHGKTRAGRRWLVDPIDGTELFLSNDPEWKWSVTLALRSNGRTRVGVIYFPRQGLLFHTRQENHSFLARGNDSLSTLTIGNRQDLSPARVNYYQYSQDRWPEWTDKLRLQVQELQREDDPLCLLIGKTVDVQITRGLDLWDIAPLEILIQNAGGATLHKNDIFIATNQILLPKVEQIIFGNK